MPLLQGHYGVPEDVRSFHQSIVDRDHHNQKASSPDNMEIASDADTEKAEDIPAVPMRRKVDCAGYAQLLIF